MDDLEFPIDCKSLHKHSRTIVHIDIDCFYAQVEMIRSPELRDKPLGIQQKNIVVTCNYKARELGVHKLMFISDAIKKCPSLVLVSGEDLTNYRAVSSKLTDLLQSRFSPTVERLGFDENFIDITKLVSNKLPSADTDNIVGHIYGDNKSNCSCGCTERIIIGSQIAAEMRQNIYDELGLTTCAGISYNKILAKLVGEKHKPNQQTILFHNQVLELINILPSIRSIPGIGRQTAELLKTKLGINSIENLQRCSLDQLVFALGSKDVAITIQKLGLGIDDSDVKNSGKPQSIGLEDAFKEVTAIKEVEERLGKLLQHLLELVATQEESRSPGTLRVSTRKFNKATKESQRESRQCSLPSLPSGEAIKMSHDKLMSLVMELFHKMITPSEKFHLTLLGIAFTNFYEHKKGKASILTFLEPATKRSKLSCEANISSQSTVASCSSSPDLPPNVDPEVFSQLPPDMQEEILSDWKQQKKNQECQQQKRKLKNSIDKYFIKNK
jgi:DNA polymerase iota